METITLNAPDTGEEARHVAERPEIKKDKAGDARPLDKGDRGRHY